MIWEEAASGPLEMIKGNNLNVLKSLVHMLKDSTFKLTFDRYCKQLAEYLQVSLERKIALLFRNIQFIDIATQLLTSHTHAGLNIVLSIATVKGYLLNNI